MKKPGFYFCNTMNALFLVYPCGKVEISSAVGTGYSWVISITPDIWRKVNTEDIIIETYE